MTVINTQKLASRLVVLELSDTIPGKNSRIIFNGHSYRVYSIRGKCNQIAIDARGDFTGSVVEFI